MHSEHLPKPRMRDLQTELKIDTLDAPINIFLIFEKSFHFPFYCSFFFSHLKLLLWNSALVTIVNTFLFFLSSQKKKKSFIALWITIMYSPGHIFATIISFLSCYPKRSSTLLRLFGKILCFETQRLFVQALCSCLTVVQFRVTRA